MKRKFVTPFKNPPPSVKPSSSADTTDKASSTSSENVKTTTTTSSSSGSNPAASQNSNGSQDQQNSCSNSAVKSSAPSSSSSGSNAIKKKFVPPTRTKPIEEINNSASNDDDEGEVWTVMHTKNTNKKHKTFDDGILLIKNKRYTLFDSNGKQLIAKPVSKVETFREGDQMVLGGKLCEFMNKIKMEDYVSGRIFLQYNSNLTSKTSTSLISKTATTKFKPHNTTKTAGLGYNNNEVEVIKAPEGTYILNEGHPEKDKSGTKISDVYIDSFIGENLRPHQVEGVKFMYECVMGMKDFAGRGMLLADEMGLGKTLQSIALIYTLLRRGPYGKPVIKKAIVVTNSSLVKNWTYEFDKWIGEDKIKVLTVTTKTAKQSPSETLKIFKAGFHQVLIISYNLCTNYVDELQECQCDLLICDEGHKLKNANIKIFQTLKKLNTPRRIVLSGTPLQNDLNEFFTICDFINPGLLGDATSFKNLFTEPIKRGQEPNAKKQDKILGENRSKELNKMVSQFVLRRTNMLLREHLPPKMEIVIFCGMTELQENLYKHFVLSKTLRGFINGTMDSNNALACILSLKKLLTHPNMIYPEKDENEEEDEDNTQLFDDIWSQSEKLFPKDFNPSGSEYKEEYSAKLTILDCLLKEIQETGDRVVIVSNFKCILNEVEKLCKHREYTWSRLDGSTSSDKRMQIVNAFNSPKSKDFIFLLSSKAGGCGLNLIGANRLIMLDPDWNPSNDEQAMARVWRDGQKKNVFIYRLIGCGTIEEKIFQRQIVKTGLSKSTLDEKSTKSQFSTSMLKELFKYDSDTNFTTYKPEENDITVAKEKDPVLSAVLDNETIKIPFIKITLDTEGKTMITSEDQNNSDNESDDMEDDAKSEEEESTTTNVTTEAPPKKRKLDLEESTTTNVTTEAPPKKRKLDLEDGEDEFVFEDE